MKTKELGKGAVDKVRYENYSPEQLGIGQNLPSAYSKLNTIVLKFFLASLKKGNSVSILDFFIFERKVAQI